MPLNALLATFDSDPVPFAPEFFGRAGAAMAYGMATSTLARQGAAPFATGNTNSDIAWGFYAAIGAGITVGPGALTVEYRFTNARLNFKFPKWNLDLGDLGGNTWRLGYRLDL